MPSEKDIREGALAFVNHMLNYTIRLICETNEEGEPELHAAAGLLVKLNGHIYLLSVRHAVGNNEWFMEADYCENNESTLLLKLEEPVTFENVDTEKAEAEVAACKMDFTKLKVAMLKDDRLAGVKLPVYKGDLDSIPELKIAYGFAKHNRNEPHLDIRKMYTEPVYEIGMEYDGETESGLYRFHLNGEHKGHKIYKGCSGAPIAADDGKIVGLVASGCEEANMIYGVPISMYKKAVIEK